MWARSSRRLALIVALVLHLSLHAQADALPGFSKNLFANVAPCAPLLRIIGERPNSTAPWGNFTEPPSELILQDCVDSSSYFVSDGEQLLFAVREEYPAVKVIRTQADTPLVLPNTTNMFIPGSVVVIDCQDNWLDFRKFPLEIEPIDAVAVYVRCHLLTSANNQASAIHTWTFSCSTHLPCDVTVSEYQGLSDFTREKPGFFKEIHPVIGPWYLHMMNNAHWCWTEDDIADLFPQPQKEKTDNKRWWILCAALIGSMGGLAILIFLLTPRITAAMRAHNTATEPSRSGEHLQRAQPNSRHALDAEAPMADWMIQNRDFALRCPAPEVNKQGAPGHVDIPPRRMRAVAMSEGGTTTGLLLLPQMPERELPLNRSRGASAPVTWCNPYDDAMAPGSGKTGKFTSVELYDTGRDIPVRDGVNVEGSVYVGAQDVDSVRSVQSKADSFFSADSGNTP